jgi:AcrR family transcriptional regulator
MSAKPTREERRDARTTEIVDIAAHLFAERGYAATGVSELCDAVGLGRGALYHYIDSKEQLLGRIHQRVADVLIPQGQAIVESELPAADKLRAFGLSTIGTILEYPDHVWVFMHERRVLTGPVREEFRAQRKAFEAQLEAILEQGVREGAFAIDDMRLAVLAWFGMHNYTYQWMRREHASDAATVAEGFYRIYVAGVEAPQASGRARAASNGGRGSRGR